MGIMDVQHILESSPSSLWWMMPCLLPSSVLHTVSAAKPLLQVNSMCFTHSNLGLLFTGLYLFLYSLISIVLDHDIETKYQFPLQQ